KRMAALSTLFSLARRMSLIGVDPFFHYLGHAARIFRHQTLDGVQLRIITLRRARQQNALRAAQADAVGSQLARQATHCTEFHVRIAVAARSIPAASGDVVEDRAQHPEYQHEDEQHAQYLLDDIPEPRLRVERNLDTDFADFR